MKSPSWRVCWFTLHHLWKLGSRDLLGVWLHVFDRLTRSPTPSAHQRSEWPLCCGVGLSYISCSSPAWEPVRLLLGRSHQRLIKPVYRSSALWQESPNQSAGELVYGAVVSFQRSAAMSWVLLQEAGDGSAAAAQPGANPVPHALTALCASQEERSSDQAWLQTTWAWPTSMRLFPLQKPDS